MFKAVPPSLKSLRRKSLKAKINMNKPVLYRYDDGEPIRNATAEELAESIDVAKSDGGAGVITVDGVSCYVTE